jgi:hypothetical protein
MSTNQKPIVFILSGKAHSGKDTFFSFIETVIQNKNIPYEKSSFAKFLKILSKQWIETFYGLDLPYHFFDDSVEKEREYPNFLFRNSPLKIRNVLQYIGTDIFRNQINPIFWVEQLYKREIQHSQSKLFFITDCRFPNEIEYLKSQGLNVYILKIVRNTRENHDDISSMNKQHSSEQFFNDIPENETLFNSFPSLNHYKEHSIEWMNNWLDSYFYSYFQNRTIESMNPTLSNSNDSLVSIESNQIDDIELYKDKIPMATINNFDGNDRMHMFTNINFII